MCIRDSGGDEDEGEDALFAPGGAATLPVDQMLGGRPGENGGVGGAGVQQKKESFHKKKRKFITNFCTDLTAKARSGGLDNIIGRDKELQRVVPVSYTHLADQNRQGETRQSPLG